MSGDTDSVVCPVSTAALRETVSNFLIMDRILYAFRFVRSCGFTMDETKEIVLAVKNDCPFPWEAAQ